MGYQMIIILIVSFIVILALLYSFTLKRAFELFGLWMDYREVAQEYRRKAVVFQSPDSQQRNLQAYKYAIQKAQWKWLWLVIELGMILMGIIFAPISSLTDLNAWIPTILILSFGIIGLSIALPRWDPME